MIGWAVLLASAATAPLSPGPGISESLWKWFELNETRIPGLKTAQVEFTGKRAREFVTYGVRVQNDGGVEVVPE